MSAIIGICGTNFCSLVADRRLVRYDGDTPVYQNDTTDKIFKLNSSVLFGITGMFKDKESLTQPIDDILDRRTITLQIAKERTIAYLEANRDSLLPARNYIIAGKDTDRKFKMYEIHFNPNTKDVEVTERTPKPPLTQYGISLSLPSKALSRQSMIMREVEKAIRGSVKQTDLIKSVKQVIPMIAVLDETVGKTCASMTVT